MKEKARFALAPIILLVSGLAYAQDDVIRPVRVAPDEMSGVGLVAGAPPVPDESVVSGEINAKWSAPFSGEELNVVIFESTPAKADQTGSAFPLDEFVYILSGKLILTDIDGETHEYAAGDSFVIPKGWRGYWEMQGNHRQLAVVATPEEQSSAE